MSYQDDEFQVTLQSIVILMLKWTRMVSKILIMIEWCQVLTFHVALANFQLFLYWPHILRRRLINVLTAARADVNIYAIKSCREVVYHFESFPILSCKQDEFNVWAKIVKDKEKLQVRNSKISLSRYMQHFIDLDLELDRTRKRNNS